MSVIEPNLKKLGLVEDDKVMKLYLEKLLRAQPGVGVVKSWESAEAFWESPERDELEILLVDLELPGQGGIELIRKVRRLHPGMTAIVLTSSNDPRDVFSAIRGGASGYLIKQAGPDELLRSLEAVVRDGLTLSPVIARLVVDEFFKNDDVLSATASRAKSFEKLTRREQEVLNALAKFGTAKETANALALSHETVRVHMKKIYQKLHVKSKAEAVAVLARSRNGSD
ncbi:response regulator transcription factor [Prosthecobacter sp.]|jgi:two-component system nitrate/nitrite response regulator NarL|uniref:response regulator transcription factor n=1 Tax=Prosthecobacter sp. TaxID=1965333 RepID=UPI00378465B8